MNIIEDCQIISEGKILATNMKCDHYITGTGAATGKQRGTVELGAIMWYLSHNLLDLQGHVPLSLDVAFARSEMCGDSPENG